MSAPVARAHDAAVVGGGHNGLVAAGYLVRAGLRVLVLEARDRVGGALAEAELRPGRRVPVLAHTAGRLRRSVIRDLGLARHGLRLLHPDVRAFAPQPDGTAVTLWSDPTRTAGELGPWSRADALAWPGFDRKVRSLASFLAHLQAATPPELSEPSFADAATALRLTRALRGLGGARQVREALRTLPMAVADFVSEDLESDALRAVVAARGIQYTAMGPRSAGTAAALLADSAGSQAGAAGQSTFVRGGPAALAEALREALVSLGGEVRCDAPVAAVTTEDDAATGVALTSGEEVRAPVVVSALDPKRTLLGLLDPAVLGPTLVWRAQNLRLPGTVAKVNLALGEMPRFSALAGVEEAEVRVRLSGRIVIAPGLEYLDRAFDASKYGRLSDRPYLEATIPSIVDPTLEPEGGHVMSVLVQYAPYHLRDGPGWDGRRDELGDVVLRVLDEHAPGISSLVLDRQVITPLDLERDFGMTEGHPLHGEPGLDQFFAWRPLLGMAAYRTPVRGLYLCGSGCHPGGGVTGGPGQNAAREILADLARRR